MAILKKSTAYQRDFLMVLSSDHITGATGKTVTVAISANGGAFGAPSAGATATEIANGWYYIALSSTDTGTTGDLAVHCTATSCDPTDFCDQVTNTSGGIDANLVDIAGSAVSTSSAQLGVNVVNIAASSTAATNLGQTTQAIGRGTVTTGASTTSIPTSAFTPATSASVANQLVGRTVLFDAGTTTVALRGQASVISASTASATPTLSVTALTTTPASGDTFSVI